MYDSDVGERPICIGLDDLADDDMDVDATEAGGDDSKGVRSVAGGSGVAVLASRLQTGQNVLHDVSHASTQII